MPQTSYKPLYEQSEEGRIQLQTENAKLQQRITALETEAVTQTAAHKKEIAELGAIHDELEAGKDALETDLEAKNEQIRVMELSRFASAYDKQEKEYALQQQLWFRLSIWATALLTLSVLLSIFGPSLLNNTNQWYGEPGFYLLDVIFLTLFVYALKQHSHLGNLRVDYANRKTLAQSYQHIIEDEEEHAEIKARFLEKAADIFSSTALMQDGNVTVYEALVAKILGHTK